MKEHRKKKKSCRASKLQLQGRFRRQEAGYIEFMIAAKEDFN